MKKIYVMAAFLGATSFAFNQVQKAPSQISLNTDKAVSSNYNSTKALGTTIYTNDFSVPADWTIGSSGAQGDWVIGGVADYNTFVFQSQNVTLDNFMNSPGMTSYANGYAFFDGIQFVDNTLEQNAWIEMANNIDCTAEATVTLKFEQEYRGFGTNKTYVEVSLDGGTTWQQTIDINPTVAGNANTAENLVYRNFNVNNSPTVKFRFRWESLGTTGGYGWQVDDVEVLTLSDHDIALKNQVVGTNLAGTVVKYYQIPLAQTAPIMAAAALSNRGSVDQNNVVFTATETIQGTYTGSSAPVTMLAGASDSLVVSPAFTPNAAGNYNLDYSISYDNTDDVPSNNVFTSYKFSVGGDIYVRDTSTRATQNIVYSSTSGANYTTPKALEIGNTFDIITSATATGIDFQFGTTVVAGAEIYGQIYDDQFNEITNGDTRAYITQASDARKYITLVFDNPVVLAPGEYIVTVKSFEINTSFASAGQSVPQSSFLQLYLETDWYYTTSTPVVRLNFDPTVGIENNELSNLNVSQNFPNPFANETKVVFNLKEASNVSYTVVDLTGKVVANVNEGNTMAGEHEITIDGSSFANGVYYLNINAGDSKVTRKMIVNK